MAQPELWAKAEAPRPPEHQPAGAPPSPFHQEMQGQEQRRPPAAAPVERIPVNGQQQQNGWRPPTPTIHPPATERGTTLPTRSPQYPQPSQGQGETFTPGQDRNPGHGRPPGQNGGDGYGNNGGNGVYGENGGFRFGPPRDFRPPEGRHWGWQDPDRWNRGWDPIFFQQDPNCETWQPTINQESTNIAGALNANDTQTASAELNTDLWAMRGDIYGQNQLLQEVQSQVQPGAGADLYLGQWDPTLGSWDDIRVRAQPVPDGYQPAPSFRMRTFE